MNGEPIPLSAQSHEQVAQDCVRSDPRLSARPVGIALSLIPLDARAQGAEDARDIATAKGFVETLHQLYVVHARYCLAGMIQKRMPLKSYGLDPLGGVDGWPVEISARACRSKSFWVCSLATCVSSS